MYRHQNVVGCVTWCQTAFLTWTPVCRRPFRQTWAVAEKAGPWSDLPQLAETTYPKWVRWAGSGATLGSTHWHTQVVPVVGEWNMGRSRWGFFFHLIHRVSIENIFKSYTPTTVVDITLSAIQVKTSDRRTSGTPLKEHAALSLGTRLSFFCSTKLIVAVCMLLFFFISSL